MRAHAPFPLARTAVRLAAVLSLLAFVFLPPTLLAKVEKKKHAATHHNAHPEAQSKKRDAEAKKRLAKDRKQQKKSEHQSKHSQTRGNRARPVADRTQSPQRRKTGRSKAAIAARSRTVAKADDVAKPDPATETRVHAWVNSQKHSKQTPQAQPSTDPHTATSADFVKAAAPQTDTPAANNAKSENSTGTSNPPPDNLQARRSSATKHKAAKPVSVVSIVRTSPENRPQLPPIEDTTPDTLILPTLYTRRGRLVVPPPLKGSHEILLRQNEVADDEGLNRIQNDADLDRMRAAGLLIAIPSNVMLHVDDRLPFNRRYCRPWTALFLDTLARQHYARFQTTLQLTSAVRTVEFQQQLIHRNGNAAPAEGDTASPHLTGQAIDIGKKGLSMAEIAWMRGYLLPLVQQGKIDVEEEFQQSCFHISVYKKYLPRAGAGRRSIATSRGDDLDVLATGLQ
jgi:hypothetical protein